MISLAVVKTAGSGNMNSAQKIQGYGCYNSVNLRTR